MKRAKLNRRDLGVLPGQKQRHAMLQVADGGTPVLPALSNQYLVWVKGVAAWLAWIPKPTGLHK